VRILNGRRPRAAIAVLAAGTAAAGGLFLATASASTGTPVTNTSGEAGYFVQHWDNWHIRDAHSAFVVTRAMEDLGGTGSTVSAVGDELCNPENGDAAQLGLVYGVNGSGFQVAFDAGVLHRLNGPTSAGQNQCDDGGLITDPATLRNSPHGGIALGPGAVANDGGITINVGDQLVTDLYYNPSSPEIQVTVQDVTQGVEEQYFINGDPWHGRGHVGQRSRHGQYKMPAQQFYSAGIGVLDAEAPALVAPAVNPLVTFTDATFTNYDQANVAQLDGGWSLQAVSTVNGQGFGVLVPTAAPKGVTTFTIDTGSAAG
jgi:hypothetical protein